MKHIAGHTENHCPDLCLQIMRWQGPYLTEEDEKVKERLNLPVPSAFGCVLPGVVGGTLLPAPLLGLGILDGVAVTSPSMDF